MVGSSDALSGNIRVDGAVGPGPAGRLAAGGRCAAGGAGGGGGGAMGRLGGRGSRLCGDGGGLLDASDGLAGWPAIDGFPTAVGSAPGYVGCVPAAEPEEALAQEQVDDDGHVDDEDR